MPRDYTRRTFIVRCPGRARKGALGSGALTGADRPRVPLHPSQPRLGRKRLRQLGLTPLDTAAEPTPSPADRRPELVFFALAILYAAQRLVLVHRQGAALLVSEELHSLKLLRQLQAGLPPGPLGEYWYGSVTGGAGGGGLVVAVLNAALGAALGAHAALRTQGLGWALLALLGAALVARALFGRWGPAAVAATILVASPALPGWSIQVYGNYAEGSALALLALGLAIDPGPSRWLPPLAGLAAGFLIWFLPMYAPLGLLALCVAASRPGGRALLPLGVAVGLAPWPLLAGLAPTGEPAASLLGALVHNLSVDLAPVVDTMLDRVALEPHWRFPGRGEAWPDGAFPDAAARPWNHLGSLLLGAWGLRALAAGRRRLGLVAVTLGLAALVLPIGLALLGTGPVELDQLGLQRTMGWEPRRTTIVLWIQALGHAGLLLTLARLGPRHLGLGLALLLLPASRVAPLWTTGRALPGTLAVDCWGMLLQTEPRFETEQTTEDLYPDQVQSLQALCADPRAADPAARRAALLAYRGIGGEAPCAPVVHEAADDAARVFRRDSGEGFTAFAWEATGRALEDKCAHEDVVRGCGAAGEHQPECIDAARASFADPRLYRDPIEEAKLAGKRGAPF